MKNSHLNTGKLGILGGSGLYNISIDNVQEVDIDTPYGKPSDSLRTGSISGMEVVFLARHGRHHNYLPTEVPYQANIWAMKSLGVQWIISASAVGSLKENIKPLDMVIPDQFIDRTHNRPISFFGEGVVAHVSMAEPFCMELSKLLRLSAESVMPNELQLHFGGTYLCMEGPAFSTKAESNFYRSLNCSVIGMTNHTEARLAKEAEIAYSSLAMSTDYDCWHEDHENVTVDMIVNNLKSNAKLAEKIIFEVAKNIFKFKPSSKSHEALKYALLTDKNNIPRKTMNKINLLTKKYWEN